MDTVITSKEQYDKFRNEMRELMMRDPDVGTADGERLSLLALAVNEYEEKKFFFDMPSPIEAIRFRMEEQGLKQNDLIPFIGSKSKVSEILAGKRNLTIPMIRALNSNLGIPLDVLIQNAKQETLHEDEIAWDKFPTKEMEKKNWIKKINLDVVEDCKSVIGDFLAPLGGLSELCIMWRRSIHSRNDSNSNRYGLLAWVARAMILADKVNVGEYDKSLITVDYLRELGKLSRFNQGPLLAKEKLANYGIKLIFLEHLSATKVDGACFLDKKGHPVIAMSLRHDRLDNFWFTLLHEMSHVYKHLSAQDQFIDNLDVKSADDLKEKEADKIASESLIPRQIWQRSDAFELRNQSAILALAKQLDIHPAIVAGRIRYETGDYSRFVRLVGNGEVKKILRDHING